MIWRILSVVAIGAIIVLVVQQFRGADSSTPGTPLAEVMVPELSSTDKAGEAVFNANCAGCHGVNAVGQEGVAPPLVHKIYEPGHHGDQAFVLAAKQGVRQHHWRFCHMPPVANVTDDEIAKIISYVRTLQRANGIN